MRIERIKATKITRSAIRVTTKKTPCLRYHKLTEPTTEHLTSTFVVNGKFVKDGDIVELDSIGARDLVRRGLAIYATESELMATAGTNIIVAASQDRKLLTDEDE